MLQLITALGLKKIEHRELVTELEKLLKLEVEVDSFNNIPHSFRDFPLLKVQLEELLLEHSLQLSNEPDTRNSNYYQANVIGQGAFELQRHTASVNEHTDDIVRSRFFGLYVIATETPDNMTDRRRRYFDNRTELRYFTPGGTKVKQRLEAGTLLIFNPRRNHELVFYGYHTTYMIFDVVRKKHEQEKTTGSRAG